jgi:hypothetical protein
MPYAQWLGPWRQHFDEELRLRQNHWKNQEVWLLYSLYSVTKLQFFNIEFDWSTCLYFSFILIDIFVISARL